MRAGANARALRLSRNWAECVTMWCSFLRSLRDWKSGGPLSAQRLSRDQDSRFGKRRLSGEPVRSGKRDGVTERQPARAAVSGGAGAWKWNSGAKDIVRI